jgi:hypothetical protein
MLLQPRVVLGFSTLSHKKAPGGMTGAHGVPIWMPSPTHARLSYNYENTGHFRGSFMRVRRHYERGLASSTAKGVGISESDTENVGNRWIDAIIALFFAAQSQDQSDVEAFG